MVKDTIEYQSEVCEILEKFQRDSTNLLPILLEVQEMHPKNYVSEEIAVFIAKYLGISIGRVAAAISFFSALSSEPRGKNIIRVCKSTACMVNNGENLLNILKKELNVPVGETSKDELFTLELTECIGACDVAPAFKINENVYGNLTREKIIEIINDYKSGVESKTSKQISFTELKNDKNTSSTNIISKNFKNYNPESLSEYKSLGGFKALEKSFQMTHDSIIESIDLSGLRGRGGAGYPTGKKLRQAKAPKNDRKVIICNADEGEPGTFKDRQFIEHDPFKILEGMIITGNVIDATEGYIYVRHEYNHLHRRLHNVVSEARKAGLLGKNILGSGYDFDIKVFSGGGAYICGEGGALIESMEGKIGYPRVKPPYTKQCGLEQLPTLVINVETLCSIATILDYGPEKYAKHGTKASPGTKLISLSGNVSQPGAFEVDFGITINDIIENLGRGVKDQKHAKFIQLGGASGPLIPKKDFDVKLCYNDLKNRGYQMGSGAVVVCDEDQNVVEYLKNVYEFFEHESCGKCTPCREGNHLIVDRLDTILKGEGTQKDLDTIKRLALHMKDSSFCGGGKTAPTALLSAFRHFNEDFSRAIGE
ncbi:MAG TPA: NAD(P)H-dependent oxidoreductase subunit E [Clostridia bacterium]|nr:NAD(P)H-dependent oxidoreductase subunit E [Clostridia bacterium]